MTPYVIFVIVLTIAYIIYYGYHISKDLYGKKNEKETSVEEFDVSGMQDEVVATPVRESGDGFSLGEETAPDNDHSRVWKSHAILTLLATQDCPLWLQYD